MKGTREGTRTRRKHYKSILWRARRVRTLLNEAVTQVEAALATLDELPSERAMAERAVQHLRQDVDALVPVIANCEARVIHERKVPMADKKLSVSDPDVGFIAKGQRVPVVGYEPPVARGGADARDSALLGSPRRFRAPWPSSRCSAEHKAHPRDALGRLHHPFRRGSS